MKSLPEVPRDVFGRATKKLINELCLHALNAPRNNVLSEGQAAPRLVDSHTNEVFFLFTDASFDGDSRTGGVGGVLFGPDGFVIGWFGEEVSPEFCNSFMDEEREQAIGELEACAVLVAYRLWKDKLRSKHIVVFIDNGRI